MSKDIEREVEQMGEDYCKHGDYRGMWAEGDCIECDKELSDAIGNLRQDYDRSKLESHELRKEISRLRKALLEAWNVRQENPERRAVEIVLEMEKIIVTALREGRG